jgi:ethanolamine utilization protein EutA
VSSADIVQLVGLDFGTTTSSAVVATARLRRNAVTGRTELDEVHERYRSTKVLTPRWGDMLDESALAGLLDDWLAAGGVAADEVFGGGALVTGLTARATNVGALVTLIRQRLGEALVARADDPCLEAWLAFMGSCAGLSRACPDTPVINLDIGGGTTNIALGKSSEVTRTGCLHVGARHLEVEAGSYRLRRVSAWGQALLDHLGVTGTTLSAPDVEAIVDVYVQMLEDAVQGGNAGNALAQLHTQVAFQLPELSVAPLITLSGGVGELVYDALQGRLWPATTAFGDLGIDLARRLIDSPLLGRELRRHMPEAGGRATVYGLLRHSTEISGSTVFLSDPALLPLTDVPILGSIGEMTTDDELRDLVRLLGGRPNAVCVRVGFQSPDAAAVSALGTRLEQCLRPLSPAQPLVLLVRENLGKTLGNYVTRWGAAPRALAVLDEIAVRDAQYVHIGRPRAHVIPVSYYGLRP